MRLAEIGALSSFGFDRREALWQAERAVRPAGELFEDSGQWTVDSGQSSAGEQEETAFVGRAFPPSRRGDDAGATAWPRRRSEGISDRAEAGRPGGNGDEPAGDRRPSGGNAASAAPGRLPSSGSREDAESGAPGGESRDVCPLPPMTLTERLVADYAGTSLTIGPHPMALRRPELAMRGVLRAIDLTALRHGRRVRVAGAVITPQRPGTAKGFVFLTLEDETGISNIIIRPDLFVRDRLTIIEAPFLIVEGTLQNQEGITSVRAERLDRLGGEDIDIEAHNFY